MLRSREVLLVCENMAAFYQCFPVACVSFLRCRTRQSPSWRGKSKHWRKKFGRRTRNSRWPSLTWTNSRNPRQRNATLANGSSSVSDRYNYTTVSGHFFWGSLISFRKFLRSFKNHENFPKSIYSMSVTNHHTVVNH